MDDLRKAAEMAMKWMEATHHTAMTTYSDEAYKEHCKIERKLRQALAQSEQEPMFWYRRLRDGMYEGPIHNNSVLGKMLRNEKPNEWKPLYTAPPSKQWVGLTDEERMHFNNRLSGSGVAEEIESVLRNRNA